MEEVLKTEYKIIRNDLIVLLILIVSSFIIFEDPVVWVKGYIFGGLIGILNFILLGKTLVRALKMSSANARRCVSFNYFIRMFITATVIIIGLRASYISGIAVIIGLLLIKVVIIFTQLFEDKQFIKEIFKRKEDK